MIILRNTILAIAFLAALFGCKKEEQSVYGHYKPRFVVEGWIEQGDYPHVILTHNIPFFTSLDSAQLSEVVIRWAKVSVSDGQTTEVLTAKKDNDYFPAYIYKGNELRGMPGKTYTLTIEYAGNTLTSTTSIPPKVPLDSVWFIPKGDGLDKVQLQLRFKDNPSEKNYYKIYTKTSSNKRYIPTLLSNHDDKYFNGKLLTLQVNRGPENNLTVENQPYFNKGEAVMIKFATIPKEGFDFWSTFQDEVINSSNPLVGSTGKIKSNIQGPGLGIWCGYGSYILQATATP
ncbi:DUF4249 domain-containing protein [Pedobacter sp. SYSU D00535]|uniref:DUF4249 domain-containing protein n=1 Tax=Pedobacter sp. SYSU D00535 TaxID=2810308 RepID=UPI001A95973F|nr:DUF4249 domain-containing protein [Pedobacter sp. SYSU D00535]